MSLVRTEERMDKRHDGEEEDFSAALLVFCKQRADNAVLALFVKQW